MRTHAIKTLVEKLFAEQFNKWGYFLDENMHGFFTKRRSEDLLNGIFLRFIRRHENWQIEFYFASHFLPIERELDALNGGELRTQDYLDFP